MAASFTPTGSYSNLTRLQLEQLRKADFYAGGKALTVGDSNNASDTSPYSPVGIGDINAEQFVTEPSTLLTDVYSVTPPGQPGAGLETITQFYNNNLPSETVTWYGPQDLAQFLASEAGQPANTFIGKALSATTFQDASQNFLVVTDALLAGNTVLLLIFDQSGLPNGDNNVNAVASVTAVSTTTNTNDTLTCSGIVLPGGGTSFSSGSSTPFRYAIMVPTAVRMFAYPGSGPTTGQEQTFLCVNPNVNPSIHSQTVGLTTAVINSSRVTSIVPPNYNASGNDAADSIFGISGPRTSLNKLGYRWIVYPDTGSQAPDLAHPIASTTTINSVVPNTDARFTFDYKAGIFRLSAAPDAGVINKAVDPTSGRLNLWAIFWAVDQSLTAGSAPELYSLRSTTSVPLKPGKVSYDNTSNIWRLSSSTSGNDFAAQALGSVEDPTLTTRWGVWDASSGFTDTRAHRGLVWSPGAGLLKYTQHSPWMGGDPVSTTLVGVADKTALTVGDISAPPRTPGADFNATSAYQGTSVGARKAFSALSSALTGIIQHEFPYHTVRLRSGRYYADQQIVIPPSTTIEGDGDSTQIVQRSIGQPLTNIFKMGSNSNWNVYDYGAAATSLTDGLVPAPISTHSVPTSSTLEGMGCVWNPVRGVWAYVWADSTLSDVRLQEVSSGGSALLGSNGVSVKINSNVLFTNASTHSSYHTPNHYPRIAYHEHTDTYAIVWVEQTTVSGIAGPVVKLIQVGVVANAVTFPYGSTAAGIPTTITGHNADVGASTYNFSDHPSVAVDTSNTTSGYTVWVQAWGYTTTSAGVIENNSTAVRVGFASGATNGYSDTSSEATYFRTVTSTDIKDDGQGGYMAVASTTYGVPFFSTTGTMAWSGGSHDGTITDSFPGGGDYSSYFSPVEQPPVKFIYISPTSNSSGYDGWVPAAASNHVQVVAYPEDAGVVSTGWANTTGNLSYALVPASFVECCRFFAGSTLESIQYTSYGNSVTLGPPGYTSYVADTIEPSYVKLSRGNGQWLLAYQAMNTTGYLCRSATFNFDNGEHSGFIDNLILMGSLEVFREHVSTCSLILTDTGVISYPIEGVALPSLSSYASRDIQTSTRSLGVCEPITYRPNFYDPTNISTYGARSGRSRDREISPGNFFYRWSPLTGITPSLFPDVAWTGSDWVVVSPTQDKIHSKIGTYTVDSTPNYYLTDATFYFGAEGPGVLAGTSTPVDGNWLKRTINVGVDQIYFPSNSTTSTIVGVLSEHTIVLAGNPLAKSPSTVTNSVEWVLIKPATIGQQAGFKNPGYRVSGEGRVSLSSRYLTMSDSLVSGDLDYVNTVAATTLGTSISTGNTGLSVASVAKLPSGWGYYILIDSEAMFVTGVSGTTLTVTRAALNTTVAVHDSPAPIMVLQTPSKVQTLRRPGQDGHNLPGVSPLDIGDPEARILADVGFHGVCVGAPKGTSNIGLNEPPMVAIAWADTSYGVIQRHIGGAAGSATSFIELYKQSFGPYSSSVKNLRITTDSTVGNTGAALKTLSSKKVFTRHLVMGATVVNGDFATDGYRNCYLQAGSSSYEVFGTTGGYPVNLAVSAYYTDALGGNAINKQGPIVSGTNNVYIPEYAEVTGTHGDDGRAPNLGGTPHIIWDGSRFVGAWVEERSYFDQPGAAPGLGAYVCLGVFPGDEDRTYQSLELVGPTDTIGSQYASQIAKISSGGGSTTIYQCAIAFSGKTYAVVWAGGMDTVAGGGSVVGVTFFDAANSSGGGGTTYILGSDTRSGYIGAGGGGISFPKIIWDGRDFVATWLQQTASGGGATNGVMYAIIPESGPVRASQVKHAGGYLNGGTSTGALGMGSTSAGVITITPDVQGVGNYYAPQPGDLVVVTCLLNSSAVEIGVGQGVYVVVDYDPSTGICYVATTYAFGNLSTLYGYIIGGSGVGNTVDLPTFGVPTFAPLVPAAPSYGVIPVTSTGVYRIHDMCYNETTDEYAMLVSTNSLSLSVIVFRRDGDYSYQMPGSSLGFIRTGSIAWNGQNYLISFVPFILGSSSPLGESLNWALLSSTLQIVDTGTTTTPANLIGNLPGHVPGPLYQPGGATSYVSSSQVLPRLRNTKVVWNPRLNRWVVSLSVLWYCNDQPSAIAPMLLNAYVESGIVASGNWTWSGHTITITSGTLWAQPGCKVIMLNGGNTQVCSTTVTSVTSGTSFTVDMLSTEAVGTAITSGLVLCFREDVFTFTLGSSAPALKMQDADNTYLENVTIGGGGADIEEFFPSMARPIWQSGGGSSGQVATTTTYEGIRPPQYNHLLMTPTLKVALPRYTNVRSTTRLKYGGGLVLGMTPDRYLYDGLNRRG